MAFLLIGYIKTLTLNFPFMSVFIPQPAENISNEKYL